MAPKPIPFSKEKLEQIQVMAGLGLPIERIALILGISESTFYRRKKMLTEVDLAYQQGAAKSEYSISKTLYEMATIDRNLAAAIWFEKTRFKRSDRTEVAHKHSAEEGSQVLIYLPDNEREETSTRKVKAPPEVTNA